METIEDRVWQNLYLYLEVMRLPIVKHSSSPGVDLSGSHIAPNLSTITNNNDTHTHYTQQRRRGAI